MAQAAVVLTRFACLTRLLCPVVACLGHLVSVVRQCSSAFAGFAAAPFFAGSNRESRLGQSFVAADTPNQISGEIVSLELSPLRP